MQLVTVKIDKPEATNFILGQAHFIKTVEDVHEALVAAVPGIRFGIAFCEASGQCLVRWSGTDASLEELARKNATALAAGHSFIIFLGDGFFPINVLNAIKMVPEVCRIFCATACRPVWATAHARELPVVVSFAFAHEINRHVARCPPWSPPVLYACWMLRRARGAFDGDLRPGVAAVPKRFLRARVRLPCGVLSRVRMPGESVVRPSEHALSQA